MESKHTHTETVDTNKAAKVEVENSQEDMNQKEDTKVVCEHELLSEPNQDDSKDKLVTGQLEVTLEDEKISKLEEEDKNQQIVHKEKAEAEYSVNDIATIKPTDEFPTEQEKDVVAEGPKDEPVDTKVSVNTEPPTTAKTWNKAGSKPAELVKEQEKKEEVTLKKVKPVPKKEEDKKVEMPVLKPTQKAKKKPQNEEKETIQLKPLLKSKDSIKDDDAEEVGKEEIIVPADSDDVKIDSPETKSKVAPLKKKKKKVRLNIDEKAVTDEQDINAQEETKDIPKEDANKESKNSITQESHKTFTQLDDKDQITATDIAQVEPDVDVQQV